MDALDSLFNPRSVAVIGASRERGSIGAEIFHNILSNGFRGAAYPVNSSATAVQGVKAYKNLSDIPDPIDLAVVVVPANVVPATVEECIKKGVRGIVVISAGFGEVGGESKAIQDRLVERVRAAGIRMVGPNCLGLLNTDPSICLDATFAPTWPPPGNVAFSSQSGALGLAILDYAQELGIGMRHFVSVGNKADVSSNDLITYWDKDPAVSVILLYLESFGNPQRFLNIASRVSRGKPIVAVKSGRTSSGARAASSHTGALAGSDAAVEALLHQAGVIRTDTIEQLFDVAMILANQPLPQGRRVAILTNAGGPGIMAADACESRELVIAELAAETVAAMRAYLPKEASTKNPVDMIASAPASSFEKSLALLINDDNVDSVIVLYVPPVVTEAQDIADAILRATANSKKTILTCFMGTHGVPPALSSLRAGKIPSYAFPEAAAIALSHVVNYSEWKKSERTPILGSGEIHLAPAAADAKDVWLGAAELADLFSAYEIKSPVATTAGTVDQAQSKARIVGFPLVMKVQSRTLTHKSDVGGVILNIKDERGVREAFTSIEKNIAAAGKMAAWDGVLMQPMLESGVELFLGMSKDPKFGPLLAFGIGGTQVEVWHDVLFRMLPLSRTDAYEMMDGLRGKKLLGGFRNYTKVNREKLADTIVAFSRLVQDHPHLREIEINPLVSTASGELIALDARAR